MSIQHKTPTEVESYIKFKEEQKNHTREYSCSHPVIYTALDSALLGREFIGPFMDVK